MKITIKIDNEGDARRAHSFLSRALGSQVEHLVVTETRPPVEPVVTAAAGEEVQASSSPAASPADKPARKPRADRGQKREPYGQRSTTTTGEPAEKVQQDGTDKAAASAPAQSALPATPTISSAPTPTVQPGATPGPAPAAEEFPATLDGARKAMKALDGTQGKGMEACIAALKAHGVTRISDLKTAEQFAPFIKDVLEQSSPEGIETARKWAGGQVAKK